jgi:hypothetical protein
MDIHVLALAFMAVIYTVIVLVSGNLIAYLLGKYWPRIKVRHTSIQPAQRHLALKEGQTIVGVRDTTKAICFYIDTDRMDKQSYE